MSPAKSAALALAAIGALAAVPASADYKVLYSFCNDCAKGSYPNSLIEDAQGNLFGTTSSGGIKNCGDETPYGCGTVFELKRKKGGGYDYSVLYKFQNGSDGAIPSGPLVIDTSGNLYGITSSSDGGNGWGNAFRLVQQNGAWSLKVLYTFCPAQNNCPDGAQPVAGLTYAGQQTGELYDGTSPLFGTASVGGQGQGFDSGVAFELQPKNGNWKYQVIYYFCSVGNCADGGVPEAPLLEDVSGNLYGTTMTYGGGVFELAPVNGGWSEKVLYAFCSENNCSDGWSPDGLAMDSSGALYGLTNAGGHEPCSLDPNGCGVAYKLTSNGTAWQETVLHAFCGPKKSNCSDGAMPQDTPIFDASGIEFGTAIDGGGSGASGTLFEWSGSNFQVLHRFCNKAGCTDGANPTGNLVLGAGGAIFGTARSGGTNGGGGVVYEYVPYVACDGYCRRGN